MNVRRFTYMTGTAGISALGVGLALSACTAGTSSASAASAVTPKASARAVTAQPTAASPAGISAPAVSTPGTAVPPGTTLVPMQRADGGEFVSPSGNINCEVDLTAVFCYTGAPEESATLSVSGKYTVCTGVMCLANAGEGTPTLAYGTATGVGPFRCESAVTGVTCTANGRGFRISASGITSASA